jgi:hypothetical protein
MTEANRILYLAVPIDIFNPFFQERFTQAAILAYEPNTEEIIQWKS